MWCGGLRGVLLLGYVWSGGLVESLETSSNPPSPKVWGSVDKDEKHAMELDLTCSSYEDYDWMKVKKMLWRYFQGEQQNNELVVELIKIARGGVGSSDCYIGLFCLGIFTFVWMQPVERKKAIEGSTFLADKFHEAIPLTYWDTIAAGWPVFHIFDLLSQQLREDFYEGFGTPVNIDIQELHQIEARAEPHMRLVQYLQIYAKQEMLTNEGKEHFLQESLDSPEASLETVFARFSDPGNQLSKLDFEHLVGRKGLGMTLDLLGIDEKYARACGYFLLTENVVKKIAQEKERSRGEYQRKIETENPYIRFSPSPLHQVEKSTKDNPESRLEAKLFKENGAYRKLVMEARNLLLLGEMQLEWKDVVTLYEKALISSQFWPIFSLLKRLETTNAVTRHYSKLLPDQDLALQRKIYKSRTTSSSSTRRFSPKNFPPTAGAGAAQHYQKRDLMNIALSGNRGQLEGTIATVNSIIMNANRESKPFLLLHVFLLREEYVKVMIAFRCSFDFYIAGALSEEEDFVHHANPDALLEANTFLISGVRLKFHFFADEEVASFVTPLNDASLQALGNLTAPHNYVRFTLADRLSRVRVHDVEHQSEMVLTVNVILYLDVDVIVKADLHDLFQEFYSSGKIVAAVPRLNPLSTYLHIWDTDRLQRWLPGFTTPSFNAGMMMFNLKTWRELGFSDIFNELFNHFITRDARPWRHGSQPPLLLEFASSPDLIHFLDSSYNVDGLGHTCQSSLYDKADCEGDLKKRIESAKILHWTGPQKPWYDMEQKIMHRELW